MESKNNKKKKNFLYYGIHLEDEIEKKFLLMTKNSINEIYHLYKEEFNEVYDTISKLIKNYDRIIENRDEVELYEVNKMKYPKHFHITIAFGGRKGFNKNSKAVKCFEFGKEVSFRPLGLIILPGKLIISPVLTDAEVENTFPHVTTFLGSYKPVESNSILENLFNKNMPLEKEYESIKEGKRDNFIIKTKANILSEEQEVYIHLTNKNEELKGKMKGYYY